MNAMELSEFHKEALENVTETETTTIINLRLEMKADELREATLFEAEVAVLARRRTWCLRSCMRSTSRETAAALRT